MKKSFYLCLFLSCLAHAVFAQCDMDLNVSTTNVSCSGNADGSISVVATNGPTPYTFDIGSQSGSSNGSFTFSNLVVGAYTITVTDADNCSEIITAEISSPAEISLIIAGDLVICQGNTVCIDALANGGTGIYNFTWNDGSTGMTLCVDQPGTYFVIVTDSNGCSAEAIVVINSDLPNVAISGVLEICPGGSTILDAGFHSTYLWNDGSTNQTINVSDEGLYSVTVTDLASGCTGSTEALVTEKILTPEITGDNVFCTGGSTILDAGAGYTNYNWSSGETTQTIEVFMGGDYSVLVTDLEGCSGEDMITVFEMEEAQPVIAGLLSFCSGASTILDAGVWETYDWSSGETTQTIEVDATGVYEVTVTDPSGCTGVAEVTVAEMSEPIVEIEGNLMVCEFGSTFLQVNQSFVNYQWSTNSLSSSINVDVPGIYSVTVTDVSGCTGTSAVEVTEADPIQVEITGTAEICGGETTILDAGGGFAAYQWSNGANSQTIQVVFEGIYSVTVIDQNGCFGVAELFVNTSDTEVDVELMPSTNCSNDGSASAIVNGDFPPFTFAWSAGGTGDMIDNLSPGFYMLTVTNAIGCTSVSNFTLPFFSNITATIEESDILCNGEDNGEILLSNVTGTPPFTYTWSDGNMDASRTNLAPGNYNLTITDSAPNNCPFLQNFVIDEPELLEITDVNISQPCLFLSNGSIDISVSGGSPGYTYQWSPNLSAQQDIVNADPGTYSVIIFDGNGCSVEGGPYVIGEPEETITEFAVTDTDCNGSNLGTIDLTVLGGSGPFTFEWTGPNGFFSTSEDISALEEGLYISIVRNVNGCDDTTAHEVMLDMSLMASISATDLSCIDEGTATVEAVGGSGTYTYLWNNGETTATIENLMSGDYEVVVTDGNTGCTTTATVFIDSPIDLEVTSTQVDCDMTNGTATAEIIGGAVNPTFTWSNGSTGPMQTGLAPGFYSVTVVDMANNCETHENVEVLLDDMCFVRISGRVTVNLIDDDCEGNFGAANLMIQLSDGQVTFTDANGYYEFISETPDAYALTLNYNPTIFEALCADPITVNAFTYGEHYDNNNFYLKYGPDVNRDLTVKVSKPNARPGFTQKVRICLMNVGAVTVSGELTYVHPDVQTFNQGSPLESNYDMATRTVTWDFQNIPPNTVWVYNAYMYTPIGTPLGTPLDYYFQANPLSGDITPLDNIEECSMEVTGSYDPNDKQVSPIGIGEEGIISMTDTLLSYHIRFQNTGTDTAFTVVITDELDADLDPSTIVPGPSSHPYTLDVIDGNILEFTFDNIMLPDSNVNEVESHGFVFFDVQTRPNLEYGTQLDNKASIFFDFNDPIITNTVSNLIQMIVATDTPTKQAIAMQLMPNPLNDTGQLRYQLEEAAQLQIDLLDINGRMLKKLMDRVDQAAGEHQLDIDMTDFVNGVYYLRLRTDRGATGVVKMVKLN